MNEEKQKIYKQEKEKSKGQFKTSFYYVDTVKAESLGIGEYKSKKDDNFIRIISPDLSKFWGLEIHVHRNIGANRATFLCMNKMFDAPCPICDKIKEYREVDSADPRIKALQSTRRYLIFLYDVTSSTTEKEGLKYYDMPSTIKDSIMSLCEDKRTGNWIEIEDPKDGKDIEFLRTGSGKGTRYVGFKLVSNEPIPKSWSKDVPNFIDILLIPDENIMKEEVSGVSSTEISDTEEEPRSRRNRESVQEKEVQEEEVQEEEPRSRRGREEVREEKSDDTEVEESETRRSRDEKPDQENSKLDAVRQRIEEMKQKRKEGK